MEDMKRNELHYDSNIGITAKSQSNSFTLFLYFWLYFSGFNDKVDQNTVSRS